MKAAYRIDGREVTGAEFYAIACDPSRPVVVEACAGAGKTWMLVARILRALLDGARPQDLLAITFTRKAAGEMRDRVESELRRLALATPSERVQALVERGVGPEAAHAAQARLEGLLESMLDAGRRVDIRTFHSWFGQLLRHAPLQILAPLGLHPDMEPIEDPQELVAACWRPFLAEVERDPSLQADFRELVRARGRATSVREWLESALAHRMEFERIDAVSGVEACVPPAHRWRPELGLAPGSVGLGPRERTLCSEAARILGTGGKRAQEAAQGLVDALALADPTAGLARARSALFTTQGEPRKLVDDAAVHAATAALQDLDDAARQEQAHDGHVRMTRLARVWFAVYARHKRRLGVVDMVDLEGLALNLLRDHAMAGWIQEQLDAKVRHLLIDEFQDTSPLQWHALNAWLSAYAGAGVGVAPTVFIVGDPKQSIYRFRGAEPRVFLAAQDFVAQVFGGHRLSCDHTRRNAPAVVEAVNEVFERARSRAGIEGFRTHTTASQDQGRVLAFETLPRVEKERGAPPAEARWRPSLTEPRDGPTEHKRLREARAVAAWIARRVGEGVPPSEIQVLARKRETLRLVGEALREWHIPQVAPDSTALIETQEADDLVALVDALVSPHHALALAQVLRSPLFACTDEELLELAARARSAPTKRELSWWSALVDGEPPQGPALQRAREWLPRWRQAARNLPPHDLLARIVVEGEVRERVLAAVPPERRALALEHIDGLLALSLDLDGGRYLTPHAFVQAVRRRRVRTAAFEREQAVQLLTIHGAKGLEADLVCIVDADPRAPPSERATVWSDWPIDAEGPAVLAFVASERLAPPSLRPLRERERLAQLREEFNALYVAMTRARKELVFSSTEPDRRPTEGGWHQVLHDAGWPTPAQVSGDDPGMAPARNLDAATRVGVPGLPRRPRPAGEEALRPTPDPAAAAGQAAHRAMEKLTALAPDERLARFDAVVQDALREFRPDPEASAWVVGTVRAWLAEPELQPWLDPAQWQWAANEWPLALDGEVLRVDRLVRRQGPQGQDEWWILDYKLEHRPQERPVYMEQLERYRRALRAALGPSDPCEIHVAFITGDARLVPV